MQPPVPTRDQAGLDRRARVAIAVCVALPVLIGVVVTAGTFRSQPPPPQPMPGHWVYVPSLSAAVHVNGGTKGVDATVPVGSASTGSLVVQDRQSAYLVDFDRMIVFTRTGVTRSQPAAGVAEQPAAVESGGTAYLVYREAGVIMRPSGEPVSAGGPVGTPVMTPAGELWVNRTDTGDICVLESSLRCVTRVAHPGALTLLNGRPVYVDTTASTWQPVASPGKPTGLGVKLPANAQVGGSSVRGRIPVVDPSAHQLLLIASGGGAISVPLGPGTYDRPFATDDAVAVVNADTGELTSYGADGGPRGRMVLGGDVRLTHGDDGRVYADATDGLQSIVMDANGRLTSVRTSDQIPPVYHEPAPTSVAKLPPANVTPTTTETIPPAPDTVTVQVTPTSKPGGGASASGGATSSSKRHRPTTTKPPPGPPPGSPTVDVLDATALGGGKARVHLSVHGDGPVFCHVFFNSVERAATTCSGVMDVTATNIPPHMLYDVYVLGTNVKGTGNPGRRAQVAM